MSTDEDQDHVARPLNAKPFPNFNDEIGLAKLPPALEFAAGDPAHDLKRRYAEMLTLQASLLNEAISFGVSIDSKVGPATPGGAHEILLFKVWREF